MKVFIALAVCKILSFVGKLIGKGSSLPGQVALKICPDALGRLKLPKTVIAVTGSNGKTSTAELIAQSLNKQGLRVGWNHEGSNQTEGVATLLFRFATLGGIVKCDAIVMECDERYARNIFEAVKPSALLVTNLCRDQQTRNGHHEFVQDCIKAAIEAAGKKTKLVLNADDPYVSELGTRSSKLGVGGSELGNDVIWFGLGKEVAKTTNLSVLHDPAPHNPCKYDDGAFCPMCKGRMTYKYRIAGHFGAFKCNSCGFGRQMPEFEVVNLDLGSGALTITINATPAIPDSEFKIRSSLCFPSLVGAYNLAAAIAVASTAAVSARDAASALDKYEMKGGRTVCFSVGGREGVLLISKHENPLAYNQSLAWAVMQKKPCTVIVFVDAISRKYYTSETSWLWDIDFDILAGDTVRNVVLAGRYASELASRFAMSLVNQQKIGIVEDAAMLSEYVKGSTSGEIYALTCFSDKAKLARELRI
ncbi:MAG: MurT ligase domain-containing protein [Oscillospiraceae bacterium]|nr:MurT ligase domain-containing protein [Oscillospiraceae bacterium]